MKWLLFAGMHLAACGSQPHCELPPHVPRGAPLLWSVHRASGPIVWLYGTIHDAGTDQIPERALQALDGSKQFVSELGDDEPDPKRLSELARLPFGQALSQLLSDDDWYDLVNALRGAMKEEDLRHARPWFAMTRLVTYVAQSPKPSMDVALAEHARADHIDVAHLESWEEQIVALDAAVRPADLAQAIHQRQTIRCELARLRAAYDASDLATLDRLLDVAQTQTLLVERNRRWLPQIEQYLATNGAFVAVGLGHMLGDRGLPAMLARAGYTVERARL
jgi:uncharacterized protein YbaP (TraB family)